MIVLHIGMVGGFFFLWGETPGVELSRADRRRVGMHKEGQPVPSPNNVPIADLIQALSTTGITVDKPKKDMALLAWLPSRKGGPISSRLIRTSPVETSAEEEVTLRPWIVSVTPVAEKTVLEFLTACRAKTTLAPGVLVGQDLTYAVQFLQLAANVVSRGQVLPSVERFTEDDYIAKWEPLYMGSAELNRQQLAKALPAVMRCLNNDATVAPHQPAVQVVTEWVGCLADTLVRRGAQMPAARPKGAKALPPRHRMSLHDRWLSDLRAPVHYFLADDQEKAAAHDLAAKIGEWQRKLATMAASPFRLCFHLQEPLPDPEGDSDVQTTDTWTVTYLLQAKDDPSLLLPVQEVWQGSREIKHLFQSYGISGPELLLTALGQAVNLCPWVEESLKSPQPAGFTLDTEQTYRFLQETVPLLAQAGFGVMLPSWWRSRANRQRLKAKGQVKSPPMAGSGMLSLDQLVQVDWQVALGDQTLCQQELQALAQLKTPLVQVRGQWVEVNPRELQSMIRQWQKRQSKKITVKDLVRLSLGAGESPIGLPLEGIEASGWIGDLVDQLDGKVPFATQAPPNGLLGQLRPYQERGYSWLAFLRRWGLGACLADDMGLGKTIQTLALVQQQREAGETRPALLVCPTSLVGNWQREARKFTPELRVLAHHGASRSKGEDFATAVRSHDMVVTSFALLVRDQAMLQELPWAGVILDEAQNIKNPVTKQSQAARSLPADYRIALTGTPVENNVGDLWSLMEFLNPGFLGKQEEFKREFFIPIQINHDSEATSRLQKMVGPLLLRRLKSDKSIIQDLPDKVENKVFCTLTREQATLYAAVVQQLEESLHEVDGIQRKGLILATLSRLKQVCNHPAQFLGDGSAVVGRSGKVIRLVEMCDELLAAGDKALIFTQFAEMGEILQRHLVEQLGREVLFLHGGTPQAQRDIMVESFQSDKGPPLFVLSLKAGGTGLNLTQAGHVFHFDRWWNPAVENQATDRAYRIGQHKNVQVHKFVCAGTLEERIDAIIESKRSLAEDIVGTGEGWLTTLSTAELKEIFALRQDALEE